MYLHIIYTGGYIFFGLRTTNNGLEEHVEARGHMVHIDMTKDYARQRT